MSRYQARRRVAVGILVALLFATLLFVRSAWPDRVHEYIEAFGIGIIIIAILGRMWCTLYIGGRKSAEIVRDGPYSVTRNPLYVFSTVGAFGIGCMTGSLIVALLVAAICFFAFHFVILAEEDYLANNFGEPYRAYMKAVPRFFPRLALFRDSGMLMVMPGRLYNTFFDGLVFLIAYPLFEFIEYLQDIGTIPVLLRLY